MRRNSKPQADCHTRGIAFDRGIDIAFTTGEIDNLIQFSRDLRLAHSHNGPVHIDVLPAGHLRMETGSDFQKSANSAAGTDGSDSRSRHLGQQLQERALSGAVLADDAHDIPLLNLEINIPKRPDIFTAAGFRTVIGLPDLQIGIFFLQDGHLPPSIDVMRKRPSGYQAQSILFSYVIELNCC